jgi:hypothetical protein
MSASVVRLVKKCAFNLKEPEIITIHCYSVPTGPFHLAMQLQIFDFTNFFYFAHELGLQLVAETSRAVFESVKTEIKTWMH